MRSHFTFRLRRPTAAAAVLLIGLAVTSDALAYRMIQNTSTGRQTSGAAVPCWSSGGFVHWASPSISWYLNTSGAGAGKDSALQSALDSWTDIPDTPHAPVLAGTTTAGWATDGINTALWATGNGCTGSCLALTALVLTSGQVITETDISFNAAYSWSTSGGDYDVESVAAHEFGHTLGLHHTNVRFGSRPTMYASYFGTDGRSLESDDESGLACSQSEYPL